LIEKTDSITKVHKQLQSTSNKTKKYIELIGDSKLQRLKNITSSLYKYQDFTPCLYVTRGTQNYRRNVNIKKSMVLDTTKICLLADCPGVCRVQFNVHLATTLVSWVRRPECKTTHDTKGPTQNLHSNNVGKILDRSLCFDIF
jgi:hypothetical protein